MSQLIRANQKRAAQAAVSAGQNAGRLAWSATLLQAQAALINKRGNKAGTNALVGRARMDQMWDMIERARAQLLGYRVRMRALQARIRQKQQQLQLAIARYRQLTTVAGLLNRGSRRLERVEQMRRVASEMRLQNAVSSLGNRRFAASQLPQRVAARAA